MNRVLTVAVAVSVLALPAAAQKDFPKAEIFGGYQFVHLNPSLNASGWNAAVNGNVNRWFGITADFSGVYKNGGHLYTYMFGPTLSTRTGPITAFAHTLLGGATDGDDSAFSMAVGAGADVNAGDHFAIRLVQADWMLFRSGGFTAKKNGRVSAGVVFRF
jgi:opacity protein-like surface antigen